MRVPVGLRRWFVAHFIIDLAFGIPLFLFPEQFLGFLKWPTIDVFSARLVGAALLGIGGVSFFARNAGKEAFQNLLTLKIIWSVSAILGMLFSMSQGYPLIAWLIIAIFAVFSSAWTYYKYKISK